jgi:hypothetical protein
MRNKVGGFFRRLFGDRGATIPEYALIVSLVVVGSFGALQVLEAQAEDEMEDTSDCIGKLPSEPGCGVGAEEVPPDPEDPTSDPDGDTIPNASDNCPFEFNADQADTDADGQGDPCDPTPNGDDDSDGVDNLVDNCIAVANPPPADGEPQTDTDNDGYGDECDICVGFDDDADADGDTVPDGCDNCPTDANTSQADSNGFQDGTGLGDACEPVLTVTAINSSGVNEGSNLAGTPTLACPSVSGSGWWCARVQVEARVDSVATPGVVVTMTYNKEGNAACTGTGGSTPCGNPNTGTRTCTTDATGRCWLTNYVQGRDLSSSGFDEDWVHFRVTAVVYAAAPWDNIQNTQCVYRPSGGSSGCSATG